MTLTRTSGRAAAMLPAPTMMTADELLTLDMPHKRTELVRGQLVVREPAGWRLGDVAMVPFPFADREASTR